MTERQPPRCNIQEIRAAAPLSFLIDAPHDGNLLNSARAEREQPALHQDAACIASLGSAHLGVALHDDLGKRASQPRIHQGGKHGAPGFAAFSGAAFSGGGG